MTMLVTDLERSGLRHFASGSECEAQTILAADQAAELVGRFWRKSSEVR